MNRRGFLRFATCGGAGLVLAIAGCGGPQDTSTELRLSGPALAESLPLLLLRRTLQSQGRRAAFTPWQSPDQLRALISGDKVDAAILTITSAAVLYNRGVRLQVAALTEPSLWIVSTVPELHALEQLHAQEVFLPFGPGETPDLLLRCLAGRLEATLQPRHTGGSLEAVNLLLAGRARHAFLSEPAASLAVRRAADAGGRVLRKAVDVREAWAKAFPESPQLAHGALAVFAPMSDAPDPRPPAPLRDAPDGFSWLRAAYLREAGHVAREPLQAAALATKDFPALGGQIVDGVVPGSNLRPVTGAHGKNAAEFLLARLMEQSPKALGGRIPGQGFLELGQ